MMATVQTDTAALLDAVRTDPVAATTKAAWLSAHLDYIRLGAAYGTFGDLDAAINGRPDGLADGVDDPAFTGFGRLEHELWQQPAGGDAVVIATQLDTDVVLEALQTPLASRDPHLLDTVHAALDALRQEIDSLRGADGALPALASLGDRDRQRLNGLTGHFLEVVAPVPDLLELPASSTPGS